MRINTTTLFYLLLKTIDPDSVYDIGSLDGTDSLRFRQILPDSRIIAFEANPALYSKMISSRNLHRENIEIFNKAVSNRNDSMTFYVDTASIRGKKDWRNGISSLKIRLSDSLGVKEVKVKSIRLDSFVRRYDRICKNLALWVDVEGNSFEVLEGISRVRNIVNLVHAEVETEQIWHGQKLEKDVEALMKKMDFIRIGKGFNEPQHDVIFIKRIYFVRSRYKFIVIVLLAWFLTYFGFLVALIPYSSFILRRIDIVRRIDF